MFITVVAVVCHLFATSHITLCKEVVVTTSDETPDLSFTSCALYGQIPIAKWKSEHPIYSDEKYTIQRYKCVPGHYVLRDLA